MVSLAKNLWSILRGFAGKKLAYAGEVVAEVKQAAVERTLVWPECPPPNICDRYTQDGTIRSEWLLADGGHPLGDRRPYRKTLVEGVWRWVEDPVEQARYDQKVADLQKLQARKDFLQKALATRIVSEEEYAEAADLGERLFTHETTYYPGVTYSCSTDVEGRHSQERSRLLKFMDLIAAQARLRKIERGDA